jgi:GntR family transcriptional regulator/MocR family aminotransferase
MTLVAREVDAEGLLVDDLEGDAVLVTPAHQFPTGSVLGAQRRSRLLDWAHTADALVIEDDYDAEFRYDREPVRALQGMAPDRVVQLGTVSKTLAPALRLGWMVVPPDLLADVLFHKAVVDEASPALNQLTLAAFLQNGDYDRQVRRARVVYRGRRDALVAELIEAFPELEVSGIEAGLHVILRLPDTANDAAVAQAGLRHGLRVSALSSFCVQRRDVKGLVIGYGRLHESAVGPAVRQLQAIISSAREAIFTEPSA